MTASNQLIPICGTEFLSMKVPARAKLIDPIISEKSITMIYAYAGWGKTNLALTLAIGLASGKDIFPGKWAVSQPRKVLYIEGESSTEMLQDRVAKIRDYFGPDTSLDNFDFLGADCLPDGEDMPNLATKEGQDRLKDALQGVALVVIDNISCLCGHLKENEAESWSPVQQWIIQLRRQGTAVLFIHHANKKGDQRGSNKKEDIMDTIITLSRPSDYKASEDLRCVVNFHKGRGIFGSDKDPFEIQMIGSQNAITWKVSGEAKTERDKLVVGLLDEGLGQREIERRTGINKATVNKIAQNHRKSTAVKEEQESWDDEIKRVSEKVRRLREEEVRISNDF